MEWDGKVSIPFVCVIDQHDGFGYVTVDCELEPTF